MDADNTRERVARLEARLDGMEALIAVNLRGYTQGLVDSLTEDARVRHDGLQRAITEIRETLHGTGGRDEAGLRIQLMRARWSLKVQWLLLGALAVKILGIKFPWVL